MTRPLPVETMHQIALCLPRQTLRTLLQFRPHYIGQVASYVFFSRLSLHFGVDCTYRWHSGIRYEKEAPDPELLRWHNNRSYQILMHIVADNSFANRVWKLKIYVPDMEQSESNWGPEMSM